MPGLTDAPWVYALDRENAPWWLNLTLFRCKCPHCGHVGVAIWLHELWHVKCRECGGSYDYRANTYRPVTGNMTEEERREHLLYREWRRAYESTPERREHNRQNALRYHWAHREEVLAKKRAYYAAHREEIRAREKAKRDANIEEARAKKRAYYQANKDKINARARAYRQEHLEEIRARERAAYRRRKEKKEESE